MIAYLRLQRFKCFSDQTISLAPLTILAGTNNSGKSTIIQALLLLRQAIQTKQLATGNIALNGPLVHLGTASDVLYQWAKEDDIVISFADTERPKEVINLKLAYDKQNPHALSLKLIGSYQEAYKKSPLVTPYFCYLYAERTGPQLTYPVSEEPLISLNVGIRGEYTAHCLQQFENQKIGLSQLSFSPQDSSQTLSYQTGLWINTIFPDIRFKFERVTQADIVHMGIQDTKENINYFRPTNVGFGISYSLPIVVAALMAQPNSLLMIENPEAHLHPAAQSKIGLFLSKVASAGVQVIIETHSDHFLNGVRIAVKKGHIPYDKIAINFVDNEHQIKNPHIDRDGRIDEWPEGFFDQAEKDLWELM